MISRRTEWVVRTVVFVIGLLGVSAVLLTFVFLFLYGIFNS